MNRKAMHAAGVAAAAGLIHYELSTWLARVTERSMTTEHDVTMRIPSQRGSEDLQPAPQLGRITLRST